MWVVLISSCLAKFHASVPAATWAATCWACEQLPRYWKPVQLHRATPSSTVTSLNSPGLLLLAMRTMRSRGPSTAPTPGELDARRADDQVRTRGVRLAECDNSRAALAEAHIVGEDGATSTEE